MGAEDLRRLAHRIALGDQAALGELYDRFGGLVYRTAGLLVGFSSAAEDVTKTVFLEVWRAPSTLAGQHDHLAHHLAKCAYRHSMIWRADNARQERPPRPGRPEIPRQSGPDREHTPHPTGHAWMSASYGSG